MRRLLVLVVVVAAAAAGVYFWQHRSKPSLATQPTSGSGAPRDQAAAHYPVPDAKSEPQRSAMPVDLVLKPLPTVDESDQTIQQGLERIFGKERFEALFIPKDIVRRFVVSIDNAAAKKQAPAEFLPIKPVVGTFAVETRDKDQAISPENYERYLPYVAALQTADMRKLVAVYSHFYSLFQSAYKDLGTGGYFNDRLIEAVDDALAAPDVSDPIKVILPSVHYHYADPKIESLSAVQRAMIRMGPHSEQVIKEKLHEMRALLTRERH